MKEVSMKTVSNIMAGVGIAIGIGSFVLNACGLTRIAMTDALIAGGFCKGVFLPVDASIWINNIFKGKDGDVRFRRGEYRSFGRNGVKLVAALELLTLVFGRAAPMQ